MLSKITKCKHEYGSAKWLGSLYTYLQVSNILINHMLFTFCHMPILWEHIAWHLTSTLVMIVLSHKQQFYMCHCIHQACEMNHKLLAITQHSMLLSKTMYTFLFECYIHILSMLVKYTMANKNIFMLGGSIGIKQELAQTFFY